MYTYYSHQYKQSFIRLQYVIDIIATIVHSDFAFMYLRL